MTGAHGVEAFKIANIASGDFRAMACLASMPFGISS
jgi:hypothetical protein